MNSKRLFLASQIKNDVAWNLFGAYVGGFSGKKCVYIPTADNGERGYGVYQGGSTYKLFVSSSLEVKVLELEHYPGHAAFSELLRTTDFLFVAGGKLSYLAKWLQVTGADKLIKDFVFNGGLYVGSSAGSMICSQYLSVATCTVEEQDEEALQYPGLVFITFDFYPHYQKTNREKIANCYTGHELLLVGDSEVVVVEDGKVDFSGDRIVN